MSAKGDFDAQRDVINCEGLLKDVCDDRDLRAPFFSSEITNEVPVPVEHKEPEVKESETYLFSARYITIVVNTTPIKVKKRLVKAKIFSKLYKDLLAEQMLSKICGRNNLDDVMVLITPEHDSRISYQYKMHCFNLSTETHFGFTSLTSRERELMENCDSPKKCILLFSTHYFDLEDLVTNSPIKMEIFGTAKKHSKTALRVLYQGTAVDLCVRSSKEVRVDVRNSIDIKTLKKPEIQVHSNQKLASDLIDYKGLYKSYGQKYSTSNLAQCRRLDNPGFARRPLKLVNHHRQCVKFVCKKRTHSIKSVQQCVNLNSLFLESQKKNANLDNNSETKLKELVCDSDSIRNIKKTDMATEKAKNPEESPKAMLTEETKNPEESPKAMSTEEAENPEESPKVIKMTLVMARKMRAECDRQKAHTVIERQKKRNNLVKQTLDRFNKRKELVIGVTSKSTSLKTNVSKMNVTSEDKTTSLRPLDSDNPGHLVRETYSNAFKTRTTQPISKVHSTSRETLSKAVKTHTTQPITKIQSTSMETYIAEMNENEKDQTSSTRLLVRETYSKEVENPSNKSIFRSELSLRQTIYDENFAMNYSTLQNILTSSDYTSTMDSQPDSTTSSEKMYEDNIVEDSIGVNNYLSSCGKIASPTLENILVSSGSTSTTDSQPDNENLLIRAKMAFLKGEFSTLDLKRSFSLFGRLIKEINLNSSPLDEHLILFFKFADLLSLKMFVRQEHNWPRCSSTNEPRCRIECFAFDDQKNYVTSIGLLTKQLKMLMDLYPNVVNNMKYVSDAFVLTTMPRTLTAWLKFLLHKNIYNLLAELAYEWVQEPSSVLKIARQLDLDELRDQQEHQNLIELIKNS